MREHTLCNLNGSVKDTLDVSSPNHTRKRRDEASLDRVIRVHRDREEKEDLPRRGRDTEVPDHGLRPKLGVLVDRTIGRLLGSGENRIPEEQAKRLMDIVSSQLNHCYPFKRAPSRSILVPPLLPTSLQGTFGIP